MSRDWKPGNVALAKYEDEEPRIFMRRTVFGKGHDEWASAEGTRSLDFSAAEWVRPLVVIDLGSTPLPSDVAGRTEAQKFVDMLRETAENFFTPDAANIAATVADQVESQIEPKRPPKPDEPTGWGAVVEERKTGHFWTLIAPEEGIWANIYTMRRRWTDIDAVRVVSEGVRS